MAGRDEVRAPDRYAPRNRAAYGPRGWWPEHARADGLLGSGQRLRHGWQARLFHPLCWLLSACTETSDAIRTPSGSEAGGGGGAAVTVDASVTGQPDAPDATAPDPLDASSAASPDAEPEVSCCTPSPTPDCCMVYGGRRPAGSSDSSCGEICDRMPLPNAAWQLGTDAYGCPIWIEPERTNDCCGCPLDGGP
jgi:hypothetical protein